MPPDSSSSLPDTDVRDQLNVLHRYVPGQSANPMSRFVVCRYSCCLPVSAHGPREVPGQLAVPWVMRSYRVGLQQDVPDWQPSVLGQDLPGPLSVPAHGVNPMPYRSLQIDTSRMSLPCRYHPVPK